MTALSVPAATGHPPTDVVVPAGVPRLIVLDSLRGIAALTVVFHHYLLTFRGIYPYGQADSPELVKLLEFSPLHLIWAGYEAVLLFFVLSGFVLALPYWSGKPFGYSGFILRRWARVWIPYIVVVTVAAGLALLLRHLPVPGLSPWFNDAWEGVSGEGYINHLLLIGNLDAFATQFVPVVWSLKYEMLASLAFPVLLYLVRAVRWPLVLALAAALNVVAIHYAGSLRFFEFTLMFLVGVLLARHKDRLVTGFRARPRLVRALFVVLGGALYIATWWSWREQPSSLQRGVYDWCITAAAALAIVVALASQRAHGVLSWRPVVWLGKVSYSLYLTHTLVQLTVLHLLGRLLPVPVLLLFCLPLALLCSEAAHRWIELPAIALGKRLSARRYL